MKILEASGIRKCFGGVVALTNGNLTCHKGKITGLLGANGSGKSTISKIIAGDYISEAGDIVYNGRIAKYRNPNEAKKDGISMVYQNLSLVPHLTIWQNIVLGDEEKKGVFLNNKSAKEISRKIIERLLPGLDINKMVYELNPGEMQIVEIAKAISSEPRLLILDEPTSALEKAQVKSLFNFMRELANDGVAIIFTSHRLWEVIEICDDLIVFRNGQNSGYIDFDKEEKDTDTIFKLITGESHKVRTKKEQRSISNETVLNIKNLNYGKYLNNISFELKKGEILGIGGLAGQGQHELMLALAGNYKGISCDAEINGKKIKLNKPSTAIKNNILFVPGDRQREGLFLKQSLFVNMIFPKIGLEKQPIFTPYKKYMGECGDIVKTLSIKTSGLDNPVEKLSGGNQQKVVVGKWLSFDINVLLLSDPTKGVDFIAKRDLYQHIVEMVKNKKISVILYASDIEELVEYCDRLMIMYEGQIVATLTGDDINEDVIIGASMRVK